MVLLLQITTTTALLQIQNPQLLRGASSERSVRARASVSMACSPSRRMFFAVLWSRSREQPQEQVCQRSSNSFWTIAPQPLHLWLVYLTETNRTREFDEHLAPILSCSSLCIVPICVTPPALHVPLSTNVDYWYLRR